MVIIVDLTKEDVQNIVEREEKYSYSHGGGGGDGHGGSFCLILDFDRRRE